MMVQPSEGNGSRATMVGGVEGVEPGQKVLLRYKMALGVQWPPCS